MTRSERRHQTMEATEPPAPCRTVSVVTPVLNEEDCIIPFYERTRAALEACSLEAFEIIFIDDGSIDGTSGLLRELSADDPAVKVLRLSRNFGHHPAVFAGLEFASGEVIVTVDVDLQDPPELIPELIAKRNEGYELVFGRRRGTRESIVLKLLKRAFRSLMRRISNIDFPAEVGVFGVMDSQIKDLLLKMPERERYVVAMQLYLGFRVGYVTYERQERFGGRPKQSMGRLFRLGMNSLFSYSSLPLQVSIIAGVLCLSAAGMGIGIVLYHKFVTHIAIPGWTSVMIAVLGMGGIQLLSLWVVCEYVERIFENTKGRPYFVIWKQQGRRGLSAQAPEGARPGATAALAPAPGETIERPSTDEDSVR